MQSNKSKIALSPFGMENSSSITTIKLVESKDGVLLLWSATQKPASNASGYETAINSIPFFRGEKTASRLFAIDQLLPPPPEWDAAVNPDDSFSLVFQRAGGAADNILVASSENPANRIQVPPGYPFDSYSKPRFVGRSGKHPADAISSVENKERLVIFARGRDGAYKRHANYCECVDGMIVRHRKQFIVFYKADRPGPVRGNDIAPGALYCARISKTGMETAVELFAGRTIFEFDVDASEESLAVFATSKEGSFLAKGASPDEPFETVECEEELGGEALSRPAILATPSRIFIAALENARTPKSRVVQATFSLDGRK